MPARPHFRQACPVLPKKTGGMDIAVEAALKPYLIASRDPETNQLKTGKTRNPINVNPVRKKEL